MAGGLERSADDLPVPPPGESPATLNDPDPAGDGGKDGALPDTHPEAPKRSHSRKSGARKRSTSKRGHNAAEAGRAGAESRRLTSLRSQARASLVQWRSEVGTVGLLIAPVPATYVSRTPDEVIDAAVNLAGRNARVLEAIAGGGDILGAIVVLQWCMGFGVSVMVGANRMDADSAAAQLFGVTKVVDDLIAQGTVTVDGEPSPIPTTGGEDRGADHAREGTPAAAVGVVPA